MYRLSLREVGEVARLAAEGGTVVHGGPTVQKLADALEMPPSDVELLLGQVRDGRSPMRDFKIVAGIAAIVVAFLLGIGTGHLFGDHEAMATVASAPLSAPVAGVPAVVYASPSAQTVARALPGGASVASGGGTPQLSAQSAPLEAKTTEGDVRRVVDAARQSGIPVTEGGDAGHRATVASVAPTVAIAR